MLLVSESGCRDSVVLSVFLVVIAVFGRCGNSMCILCCAGMTWRGRRDGWHDHKSAGVLLFRVAVRLLIFVFWVIKQTKAMLRLH